MIEVYKVPTQAVSVEQLREIVGTEGSRLNPVQDADLNWIISVEEWDNSEFDAYRLEYPQIVELFQKIPYNPPPQI